MLEIADWLKKLGMSEYAARFVENRIDFSVLRDLTDQDLKDLGVVLGDRRKLLRAIDGLRWAAQLPRRPCRRQDTAERRQVTVMFCGPGGIDGALSRHGPGGSARCHSPLIRNAPPRPCAASAATVGNIWATGCWCISAIPRLTRTTPSVRCERDLSSLPRSADSRRTLRCKLRVGIATGLVVVGDLVDAGGSQERGIIGETPNLAARVQGLAQPNTVVITENTRRLLGNCSNCEDLGARNSKASPDRCRSWTALRPSSAKPLRGAPRQRGHRACRPRRRNRTAAAPLGQGQNGEGQVVLLSGEAGIGKSRLTRRCWNASTASRIRACVISARRNTPTARFIRSSARWNAPQAFCATTRCKRNSTSSTRSSHSTSTSSQDCRALRRDAVAAEQWPLSRARITPRQRRQRTMEALSSQVETLSRSNAAADDLRGCTLGGPHEPGAVRSDSLSDFPKPRVLLVVTFRPEFEPPWIGRPHVTILTLNRLAPRDVDVMIDQVVGNKPLPSKIRQDIIERTDGIPLFVEEMTKAVLERRRKRGPANCRLSSLSGTGGPPSLHASLMARLDRLGPAKELAQIGAAIGREFSHELLAAVVCKPEAKLKSRSTDSFARACCSDKACHRRDLSVQARSRARCGLWHSVA